MSEIEELQDDETLEVEHDEVEERADKPTPSLEELLRIKESVSEQE